MTEDIACKQCGYHVHAPTCPTHVTNGPWLHFWKLQCDLAYAGGVSQQAQAAGDTRAPWVADPDPWDVEL